MEDQRRGQQRHRNRHQRNQRGAHVEQEHEEDHSHQDGAVAQRLLDVVHRMLDEVGLLEQEGRWFESLGQALAEFGHRFLDLAGQFDAVGSRLLLHRQDHCRLALVTAVAALDGRGELHVRHLLEQDRLAVLDRHDEILQVFDARAAADLTDQPFAALGFKKTAAGVGAKVLQGGFQLLALDAERLQLRRFDLDAVLPHLAADRDDLGDAGNRQQARTHHPVGIFADRHRTDLVGIGRQRDQQDLAHDRRDRPELRHDAGWQGLAHQIQAFGDLLAVAVDVRTPFELDVDDRQTDARHRAHARHARHAVHARLDREGDQLLDFLRGHAAGLGHQRHGRLVEVGEDVDRHLSQRDRAIDDQQQRDAENDQPLLERGVNDVVEHVSAPARAVRRRSSPRGRRHAGHRGWRRWRHRATGGESGGRQSAQPRYGPRPPSRQRRLWSVPPVARSRP
jgi:hypothetical protein